MKIFYWVHHTAQYSGNSGVQRVVRNLGSALLGRGDLEIVPVRWCPDKEAIVTAGSEWVAQLAQFGGPLLTTANEQNLPLHLLTSGAKELIGEWLLIPEVPHLGGTAVPPPAFAVAVDYARFYGLRIACVFYDLIPLRFPGYEELRPSHEIYASVLAHADCVFPISLSAGDDLRDWWRQSGHLNDFNAALVPLLLPAESLQEKRATGNAAYPTNQSYKFLMLGTVEPRKNQVGAMRCFNRVLRRHPEISIELHVVGNMHPAVEQEATREIVQSHGRIQYHSFLSDEDVKQLYQLCCATIFVSFSEGFGLPVAESLWNGKPCITSDFGSMKEIAEGGGCLLIDPHQDEQIEGAIEALILQPSLLSKITSEATSRNLKTWGTYASEIVSVLGRCPSVRAAAVLEGSADQTHPIADSLRRIGVHIRSLRWSAAASSLLPNGPDIQVSGLPPGFGDLRKWWALLPYSSVRNGGEALKILREAAAYSLNVAVIFDAGTAIDKEHAKVFASAKLLLFASETDLRRARETAFLHLNKSATLRQRMKVARGASEIADALGRSGGALTEVRQSPPVRRLYYWCGLTASQPFNTGIQRVVRQLGTCLQKRGVELIPVKWDTAQNKFSALNQAELKHLAQWEGPHFGANIALPSDLSGEWLVIPEVILPIVPAGSNPARVAHDLGMKVASIFFDLIPLKMKDLYPSSTQEAFKEFCTIFQDSDVILPISWSICGDIRRYLAAGGRDVPPIVPCPLAGDLPGLLRQKDVRERRTPDAPLRLLAIGTWEPRKNYVRVLQALLWIRDHSEVAVELVIVGRRAGYIELEREMERLCAEIPGVELRDHVSDTELSSLIDRSDATIFPSYEEGFGLPVIESLWRGLPCLSHNGSAMAELAPGGGVLAIDMLQVREIANAIQRLATDQDLLSTLSADATRRPIRTWDEYAQDVLLAITSTDASPGWPRTYVTTRQSQPLLTCAITTYNRAKWLAHSLPRLLESAAEFGKDVQVVVCDNASTDETDEVVAKYSGISSFKGVRNSCNVGMLGNLGATARVSDGQFVWLLGDDDIVLDGAIGGILGAVGSNRDIEMVYTNYCYSSMEAPERRTSMLELLKNAKPIGVGGPSRRVDRLKEVAGLNENLFTSIYACAFRRDHALRAYQIDSRGSPFSSMETCIPSSVYALRALQDRPAYWLSSPAVLINMNVSWLRWALLWHLERMPDLFDAAELAGVDPVRLDRHRFKHCHNAVEWTRMALFEAEDTVRHHVSVSRLIERCKHIEAFKKQIPQLRELYEEAFVKNRLSQDDSLSPDELFSSFGF